MTRDKIKPRVKTNLFERLSETLRNKLHQKHGVNTVLVVFEKSIVMTASHTHDTIEASSDVRKAVNSLMNKDRAFITRVVKRYYTVNDYEKQLILEAEIDRLELEFFNSFAWMVLRDWEKERIRIQIK